MQAALGFVMGRGVFWKRSGSVVVPVVVCWEEEEEADLRSERQGLGVFLLAHAPSLSLFSFPEEAG